MYPGKYRYSILHFQPSLHEGGTAVPVAVIVSDGYKLVILGRAPFAPEGISQVGVSVLAELPRIVKRQLEGFKQGEDPFRMLAAENRWSLFLSPTQEIREEGSLHDVAHDLFGSIAPGEKSALGQRKAARTQVGGGWFEVLPISSAVTA